MLNIAGAFVDLKKYQEAIAPCEKVLELNPKNSYAYHYLGLTRCQLKDYQTAILMYEKAIEIEPDNADFWYDFACCYALQDNNQQAIIAIEKAIALNRDKFKEYAKKDPDLTSLHKDEAFEKLMDEN